MYSGSNFTRNTTNLELEMFVTGENLLKERMNTKSPRVTTHKRCFEDAKEISASEAKQDDSQFPYSQYERVERSWMKTPIKDEDASCNQFTVGLY